MLRRLLFQNFYIVYRADQWFKGRFTAVGSSLVGAFVVAGVFGINTRATASYQISALTFALVLIAIAAAPFFRPRFRMTRRLPRCASVDQPLSYTVQITNESARWQRGLSAIEQLDIRRLGLLEYFRGREPADRRRNWFDRHVGYPRWATLMRLRKGAIVREAGLPDLPPGRSVSVKLELTPVRRGYVRLDRLYIHRPDPLGLFKARVTAGQAQSLLILPRRYPVDWVELAGASRDRLGGASHSGSLGGLEEFASLREYRPGDPMRHIHWKGWARHGVPIVKEYHEEVFARQALVLDTCLPAGGSSLQFEEAVSVAASFVGAAPSRNVMDLVFFGGQVHRVSSGPGVGGAERLLEALACVSESPDQGLEPLRDRIAEHAGELTACVCVLLAWDAPRRDLIEQLVRLGLPLLVLVVVDEAEPRNLDPGPMRVAPQRFHVIPAGAAREHLARMSYAGEPSSHSSPKSASPKSASPKSAR